MENNKITPLEKGTPLAVLTEQTFDYGGYPTTVQTFHCGEFLHSTKQAVTLKNSKRLWWKVNSTTALENIGLSSIASLSVVVPYIVIPFPGKVLQLSEEAFKRVQEQGWGGAPPKLHSFNTIPDSVIGQYCLVRDGTGIFAGVVQKWDENNPGVLSMAESRRIWFWASTSSTEPLYSLNEIAVWGIALNSDSRIAKQVVGESELFSVAEIIPVSPEAARSIRSFVGK